MSISFDISECIQKAVRSEIDTNNKRWGKMLKETFGHVSNGSNKTNYAVNKHSLEIQRLKLVIKSTREDVELNFKKMAKYVLKLEDELIQVKRESKISSDLVIQMGKRKREEEQEQDTYVERISRRRIIKEEINE